LTCLELAGVDPPPLIEAFLYISTFTSDFAEFLLYWLSSFPPRLLPPLYPPIAPNWIAEKLAIEEVKSTHKLKGDIYVLQYFGLVKHLLKI